MAFKWLLSSKRVGVVYLLTYCVCVYLLFDMLAAGHRVSHAGAGEDVHIVDNDERFLLQGDDG